MSRDRVEYVPEAAEVKRLFWYKARDPFGFTGHTIQIEFDGKVYQMLLNEADEPIVENELYDYKEKK